MVEKKTGSVILEDATGADGIIEGRRQEGLLKTGALQNAIQTSANFLSIATDAEGVIQIFSFGAERMLGYAADEVMNKITPAEISDPQELIARAKELSVELSTPITAGFEALVCKASRGIEDIYELNYIRKDGGRFPAVISVTALRDAQDAIIGYLLICTCNTARQLVEKERARILALQGVELESAKVVAEKANLAKSDFLSSISHEMRTPLSAILGFAQLMDSGSPVLTSLQKRSIDKIQQAGRYLLEVINKIDDLPLIESGKLSLSLEPISLTEVVREHRSMIEPHGKHLMVGAPEIFNASILIVDDQQIIVSLLEQLLSDAGYTDVTSTMDPREVCAMHAKKQYDLILLDLLMPGMDGFQVMEALKANNSEGYLPIVVFTAHPEHKLQALQAGAKDFITKPFDLIEVKTRIHNILEVRLLYKELANSNKVLKHKALHDSTTDLPNRHLFNDRLTHAIALAKRHAWTLAVMFLDLDRFKYINDTHGHAVGDAVLKAVAKRLLAHARDEDTVCRNGGDEFLYLLINPLGRDNIQRIADGLWSTIGQPVDLGDLKLAIRASIGIAVYPDDGTTGEELIRNADTAMYLAKRSVSRSAFFVVHAR